MKKGDDTPAPIPAPTESTETYDTHSQGNIIMFIMKQKCTFFKRFKYLCKMSLKYSSMYLHPANCIE